MCHPCFQLTVVFLRVNCLLINVKAFQMMRSPLSLRYFIFSLHCRCQAPSGAERICFMSATPGLFAQSFLHDFILGHKNKEVKTM